MLLEPNLNSIILMQINKQAVAKEWPQIYKIDIGKNFKASKWTKAKNKLVCRTELNAKIAFKSFWDINLKTISIAQSKVTNIKIFKEISLGKIKRIRTKQKYDNLIRIQLKKIDILVETSTWARGSQYQNGHVDNLVPKPKKKENKYNKPR